MSKHSVESMVNMLAAIEADMLFHKHGFYGALQQIGHVESFHASVLLSKSLKTFETKFWERVRLFIEIKHPEMLDPEPAENEPFPFEDAELDEFK